MSLTADNWYEIFGYMSLRDLWAMHFVDKELSALSSSFLKNILGDQKILRVCHTTTIDSCDHVVIVVNNSDVSSLEQTLIGRYGIVIGNNFASHQVVTDVGTKEKWFIIKYKNNYRHEIHALKKRKEMYYQSILCVEDISLLSQITWKKLYVYINGVVYLESYDWNTYAYVVDRNRVEIFDDYILIDKIKISGNLIVENTQLFYRAEYDKLHEDDEHLRVRILFDGDKVIKSHVTVSEFDYLFFPKIDGPVKRYTNSNNHVLSI